MFWNEREHKKYGSLLVLYLFWDISSFKSEKVDKIKYHVQAPFINKEDKYLYRQTARDSFLTATQNL